MGASDALIAGVVLIGAVILISKSNLLKGFGSVTTNTPYGTITGDNPGITPSIPPAQTQFGNVNVFTSGGFTRATGGTLQDQATAIDQSNQIAYSSNVLGGLFGPFLGPAAATGIDRGLRDTGSNIANAFNNLFNGGKL